MQEKRLSVKDSAISFFLGFLLCQLGVIITTCLTYIFFKIFSINTENFSLFFNTAIGYLISAITFDLILLLIFFYFKKSKSNKITSKLKIKKVFIYIGVAVVSFLCLYPIIVCIDSLLVKIGVSISTIPFNLSTKNYFISLISLVIAPAICEELLFRGIIFSGLKQHGKTLSISLTAIMFTLFHMSISQTIYPLLMGLLLSVIMYYENNIYYCIIVHLVNNLLSLTLSYLKISLVFTHWTYILLAVVLGIIFISTILYFTISKNKQQPKEKMDKTSKIYLSISLIVMILFWILVNFA